MTEITIYDTATGRVVLTASTPDESLLPVPGPGQASIAGRYPTAEWMISGGVAVPFPARPGDWAVWDWATHEWTDLRDAAWHEAAALALAASLRTDLAGYRYARQSAGVEVLPGVTVLSDRESQSTLTTTILAVERGLVGLPVQWKCAGGVFVALSADDLSAAAALVAAHVQACYDAEAAVLAQIAVSADLAALDVRALFDAALA